MVYFYKLENPKELRLNLLEAAKESLLIMSLKNKIDIVQQRKKILSDKLGFALKEIDSDLGALNSTMPNRELLREHRIMQKQVPVTRTIYAQQPRYSSRDRLEVTLQAIEEKLRKLQEM